MTRLRWSATNLHDNNLKKKFQENNFCLETYLKQIEKKNWFYLIQLVLFNSNMMLNCSSNYAE